jgi:hypothetical protein
MTTVSAEDAALSASDYARKYKLNEGNFTAGPRQAVAKTVPKLAQVPDREPTPEECKQIELGTIEFLNTHPHVARVAENLNFLMQWLVERDAIPTFEALEAAFEAVADQLTYNFNGQIITPADIPGLSAATFLQLTRKQAVTADPRAS